MKDTKERERFERERFEKARDRQVIRQINTNRQAGRQTEKGKHTKARKIGKKEEMMYEGSDLSLVGVDHAYSRNLGVW